MEQRTNSVQGTRGYGGRTSTVGHRRGDLGRRVGERVGTIQTVGVVPVALLRTLLGDALRRERLDQGRTLRDVSAAARVSLGYLSEVERGQKEASSELLASICRALEVRLAEVLGEVSADLSAVEPLPPQRLKAGSPIVPVLARAAAAPASPTVLARAA